MNTNELGNVKTHQGGFTLIELVVVIVIIAILAATVLPRFAELSEEAHEASVRGTAGAYGSAVALVKAQWTGNGAPGATEDLPGFGDETVDVSSEGWPVSTGGTTSPGGFGVGDCVDLWSALLQSNAPTVGTDPDADDDYLATVVSIDGDRGCRFEYQREDREHFIRYTPQEGEVFTSIDNP